MLLTLTSRGAPSIDKSGPNNCRLAIVRSMGLGDSLMNLVIASNLARAGYSVTMLSNHLARFAPWLPDLEMLPFPAVGKTFGIADAYDLVISGCDSIVTSAVSDKAILAEHFLVLGTLRGDSAYFQDHRPRLEQRVGADKAYVLVRLASCTGPMRVLNDDSVSTVDQAVASCQLKLGLGDAVAGPGFMLGSSAAGVRVLTLFRKRGDGSCWRPGWGRNMVVRPVISVGALRDSWKCLLSVQRVERAFELLVRQHKSVS